MNGREELRKNMFAAREKQKVLLKQRDSLFSKKPQGKGNIIQITHEIAKLEDFIRMAENNLRMSD